jgi:hypothetical protein
MIVSEQMVPALATAALPTFAVLVGILINNHRLSVFNQRFNDFSRGLDQRFAETNRHIDDTKDILRAEMFRIEQVIDARLKHLEEHQ